MDISVPADYHAWPWQVVATTTVWHQSRPVTLVARVTQRPEGWYALSDHDPAPPGPYPNYALAVQVACHRIGLAGPAKGTGAGPRQVLGGGGRAAVRRIQDGRM